ncbi:MAG TPA: hypothetical protein VFV80_12650 [Geminicoccaceae bacterium]|nr:hypothetical protein [Geminicoccaceae bacterium]
MTPSRSAPAPVPTPPCPNCGWAGPLLWVHGHGRCPRCRTVVAACCEGAPLGEETAQDGATSCEGGS